MFIVFVSFIVNVFQKKASLYMNYVMCSDKVNGCSNRSHCTDMMTNIEISIEGVMSDYTVVNRSQSNLFVCS